MYCGPAPRCENCELRRSLWNDGVSAGAGFALSRSAAKSFIDGYFDLYKGVSTFIEETVKFAHENGYVETLTGRRRVIRASIPMIAPSARWRSAWR
jgi:hypothetical protein